MTGPALDAEIRRVHALLPTDRAPTIAELAAAMAPPAPVEPDRVWVFGAFPSGHHLYTSQRGSAHRTTGLDPQAEYDLGRALDGLGSDWRREEPEGQITRCRVTPIPPGWSFVSWWDRQGDRRKASHTGILARGTWSEATLIAAGRRLAPWAFRVAVEEGRS